MIMKLDYEFKFNGQDFRGIGIEIGDADDLESEAENIEQNKISAICHELNIDIEGFEANYNLNDFEFNFCELQVKK